MTHSATPLTRLYLDMPLHQHSTIEIPAKAQHYLRHVLRASAGDSVALFNGQEGEWLASITTLTKKEMHLHIEHPIRSQTHLKEISLLFAPIKAKRLDFLVEKATELGVTALRPVQTDHCVISRVNEEKLWLQAKEAAEQTERLDVPAIHSFVPLRTQLNQWPDAEILLYGDETGEGAPVMNVMQQCAHAGIKPPIHVLTGPEGGFSHQELALLRAAPFAHAVSLGPRILRAETAALALLTCAQSIWGDWGETPAFRTQNAPHNANQYSQPLSD